MDSLPDVVETHATYEKSLEALPTEARKTILKTLKSASAMKADAYATALMVMGGFEGPDYAEAVGLAAHFVERTDRGLVERVTPAFAAMMDDSESAAG